MARTTLRSALVALALGLALVVGNPLPAAAETEEVTVRDGSASRDFKFDPARLKIDAGDSVEWTNEGREQHTVTFEGGGFDSHPNCTGGLVTINCMDPGEKVLRRFEQPGEFRYSCKLHRQMQGVVEVGPTTASSGPSTTTTEPATTTTTSRALTTSSVPGSSTSSTTPPSTLAPGAAPVFDPGPPTTVPLDEPEEALPEPETRPTSESGDGGGTDGGAVVAIVAALAAVSLGGGYLLLRLRPSRRR